MLIRRLLLGVALASLLAQAGRAETLGAIGPTYPIAEQSFLEVIMARLREKERTGELKKFEDLARTRATRAVMSPTPVPNLRRVEIARTFYFDPTFTLDRNVLDENGSLLFQAGTRKNPLESSRSPNTCCSSMPAIRARLRGPASSSRSTRARSNRSLSAAATST